MEAPLMTIKRALLSVSDKTGIVELARALVALQIEIISTGGTSELLRTAGVPTREVADLTGFPEIMDGRVKTLHPKIHGGILGQRDLHGEVAAQHQIAWIDLVVVNLYPFAQTIKAPTATFEDAIENIDIGGPTLLRAAAKNHRWVGVVVDPEDYALLITELQTHHTLSAEIRQQLAAKAFAATAEYDRAIHHYLSATTIFPEQLNLTLQKKFDLRYGENPHQKASAYQLGNDVPGLLTAKQYQGKQLSYNNIADADAAINCVREFDAPACAVVKHATPCGVAMADALPHAVLNALNADAVSAFGGIVALNRPCDETIANMLKEIFIEVLIAPSYTPGALAILATKTHLRVLELERLGPLVSPFEFKFINGGFLMQEQDTYILSINDLRIVTDLQPSAEDIKSLLFAWPVLKHIKSNAILIAKNKMSVGIGAGQVSRVESVSLALKKAGEQAVGAVLASDAFFPFRDSIDQLAESGVRAIIQPGGSVRDDEVIAACNEHKIAMVFTGKRCFKH